MAGNGNHRGKPRTSPKFKNERQQNRSSGRKDNKNKHHGCGICKADHRIVTCKKFINLNLEQKLKTVRQMHYCSNCLARNHLLDKCSSKQRCRVCTRKHHTILHGHKRVLQELDHSEPRNVVKSQQKIRPETTTSAGLPSSLHKVLVPTAQVYAMTDDGSILLRAIISPSSTTSRIANSFVEKYKLPKLQLNGGKYVQLTVTPNMSSLIKFDMYLLVVTDLPRKLYTTPIKESVSQKFENLALADPEFYTNDPIEMEIGGDLYSKLLKSNIIRSDGGSLMAQDSSLGWLILGSYTE